MKSTQALTAALALAVLSSISAAQTVTVTTSKDLVDINFFTGTIADLPGPDGLVSFAEALIATDNEPGHQTIEFHIPQSDWTLQFLYPGAAVLTGGDFRAFDSVTIDGTSQTAFTGDTNPIGNEVAVYGGAVYLLAPGSRFTGFHSGEMYLTGDNGVVEDNTGGMHINLWADNGVARNNQAGTIKIDRGNFNTVIGNTMQRVRIWGFGASQRAVGNRVGGPSLDERNFITGYGTVNSEGLPSGTDVELFYTDGTEIENNYIGTTPDGMAQGHQFSNKGIEFLDGNIGTRVRNNLIAGILGHGQGPHWAGTLWGWTIFFQGGGSDIEITGNTLGLDATGAATLPGVWGLDIGYGAFSTYTDVRVGGYTPGEGNTIAGHLLTGLLVGNATSGVRLAGNSIFGNGTNLAASIGIDLLGSSQSIGVTLNDALDADSGGNGLQNFPVLSSANIESTGTRVVGVLDSAPNQNYTLEFFASPAADPSGYGQGELPLGFASVATDGAGTVSFDALVAVAPAGWVVTATATLEPLGQTSEFAFSIPTTAVSCAADLGFEGPGTASLSLCGSPLGTGGSAILRVEGALSRSPAWVMFGTSFAPTPVLGGTVVPIPGQIFFLGGTDAGGALSFGPIPGGGGPVTLFAQAAYLDLSLPNLVGLTNALQVELLP